MNYKVFIKEIPIESKIDKSNTSEDYVILQQLCFRSISCSNVAILINIAYMYVQD